MRFAVNTHLHADHVAGNKVFLDAGAQVVAQYNVPPNTKPELKNFVAGIAPPTLGGDARITMAATVAGQW